jgi:hypothetical protein
MKIPFLMLICALSCSYADVKSIDGVILFDVDSNQTAEMTLNETGLGVGVTPSTNLHVEGNAMVSDQLFIGGLSGASNLNIHGSIGMSVQLVSANVTLDQNTTVLVNSSSDNVVLTLPYAGNVSGRIYTIKKTTLENSVQVRGGGNFIDDFSTYELSSGNMDSFKVISNGNHWYILSETDGVSSVLWTPADTATALWLDASDTTTVLAGASDNVYQWSDKSGNDLHATQDTAGSQPTTNSRTLNGINVLDFASDYLITTLNINRPDTPDLSVFAVFAQDATVGDFGLFGADNGGWDRLVLLNFDSSTGNEWGVANASGTTAFEATRTSDTSDHILSILWDSGVTNGSQVGLDGVSPTIFTEAVGSAGYTTTGIGTIRPTGTYPLDGYIAEMVFLTSIADEATRQKVEGYLAWKWGLESNLPINHPYKNGRP